LQKNPSVSCHFFKIKQHAVSSSLYGINLFYSVVRQYKKEKKCLQVVNNCSLLSQSPLCLVSQPRHGTGVFLPRIDTYPRRAPSRAKGKFPYPPEKKSFIVPM
jgi:hypothetical protein